MDAGKVMSAGIFPIRQATIQRNTMPAVAIQVEVVVGGTHKICRNNCSFGYEVVEGEDARTLTSAFSGW